MGKKHKREIYRIGLHKLYLPYYDSLCNDLSDSWQPISGLRSIQKQEALFAQGRSLPGKIVTNAMAGHSAHNWGLATDWCLFSDIGLPEWENNRWDEYGNAVRKLGLEWGGDFKSIRDLPHNELAVSTCFDELRAIYESGGFDAAMETIKL